jgi:hypothetical protein
MMSDILKRNMKNLKGKKDISNIIKVASTTSIIS